MDLDLPAERAIRLADQWRGQTTEAEFDAMLRLRELPDLDLLDLYARHSARAQRLLERGPDLGLAELRRLPEPERSELHLTVLRQALLGFALLHQLTSVGFDQFLPAAPLLARTAQAAHQLLVDQDDPWPFDES